MLNDLPAAGVPRPDGLVLAPFRALRYDPDAVDLSAVLAPPYDVIDDAERDALEARDPHNVVRLTLPRGGDKGYATAAETLAAWRSDGTLVPDETAAVYIYEQRAADGHVQRGLVGALGLSPAEDGIVLPHENTMSGTVADRLASAIVRARMACCRMLPTTSPSTSSRTALSTPNLANRLMGRMGRTLRFLGVIESITEPFGAEGDRMSGWCPK